MPDSAFALAHRHEVLAAKMATSRVQLPICWRQAGTLSPLRKAAARAEIESTMLDLILLEADIAAERDRELEEP